MTIEWHNPPLVSFLTTNNILMSVNNSISTVVLFKAAYHANPGAVQKRVGSSS